MLSPQPAPHGPAISASLRSTEFRWSRRAESEAPLRCCFLPLAHRRGLCAGEICPRRGENQVRVGSMEKTPMVIDDAIAIRSVCYLALTFDHRLIDGALGDQFTAALKRILENWSEDIL
ncbi:MAG: 2-oxo acid dehydrogenase subunit E2 [Acidobacteria bacterium]|nr:2-oxo acid dehydrogenase subunit E2 [Acidobacteriota bacterium]